MALRRIYSKYFLSKTYPAILTSRRKFFKKTNKFDDYLEEAKYDEEALKEIEEFNRLNELGPSQVERGNERGGITPEQYRFLQQDIDFSLPTLKRKVLHRKFEKAKQEQEFSLERYNLLGPELSAAHFIIQLNGAVKFKDKNKWIRMDENGSYPIPRYKIDGFFVEGIDVSNTDLMYEGLRNIEDLQEVKFLNLSNCKYIDDFCMSKLQMFQNSLEVLDISGCERVTENGLACIHHLPKLKLVSIENTPNIKYKEILTIYIEEMLPNCIVHGVDHDAILQSSDDSVEEHSELPDQLNTNKMIEKLLETEDKTASEVYKEVSMPENDNSLRNDSLHLQHTDCSNFKQEEKAVGTSSS